MLNVNAFHTAVPPRPSGRYAHIVLLRETDSFALFQTDGELNTAVVQSGRANTAAMTRLTLFKRKQTTPERLIGRELLRRYGFISAEQSGTAGHTEDARKVTVDKTGLPVCDYNVDFCKQCPDCVTYGFAIGDSGSEKSKVYSDTAYSLTDFETSRESFTLNAPYESGSMSRQGAVTNRINAQDHVRPQTLFPSVITVRDVTAPLFLYVCNNLLRTRRYGAQTTRTGTMTNHVLAVVLNDGEIFSNLLFTQRLFDVLNQQGEVRQGAPISIAAALGAATSLVPQLVDEDRGNVDQIFVGTALDTLIDDLAVRTRSDDGIRELLHAAQRDSGSYYTSYIQKIDKKKK